MVGKGGMGTMRMQDRALQDNMAHMASIQDLLQAREQALQGLQSAVKQFCMRLIGGTHVLQMTYPSPQQWMDAAMEKLAEIRDQDQLRMLRLVEENTQLRQQVQNLVQEKMTLQGLLQEKDRESLAAMQTPWQERSDAGDPSSPSPSSASSLSPSPSSASSLSPSSASSLSPSSSSASSLSPSSSSALEVDRFTKKAMEEDDELKKLNAADKALLMVLGETGLELRQAIIERMRRLNYSDNQVDASSKKLVNKNWMTKDAKVGLDAVSGRQSLWMLTSEGKNMYLRLTGSHVAEAFSRHLIADHDNIEHGYGIYLLLEILMTKYDTKEGLYRRKDNTFILADGKTVIPDARLLTKEKWLIVEYELGHHSKDEMTTKLIRLFSLLAQGGQQADSEARIPFHPELYFFTQPQQLDKVIAQIHNSIPDFRAWLIKERQKEGHPMWLDQLVQGTFTLRVGTAKSLSEEKDKRWLMGWTVKEGIA